MPELFPMAILLNQVSNLWGESGHVLPILQVRDFIFEGLLTGKISVAVQETRRCLLNKSSYYDPVDLLLALPPRFYCSEYSH